MISPRWFEARGSFFAIASAACTGHGEDGVEIHVDYVSELGRRTAYAARRRFAKGLVRPQRTIKGKGEYPLLSTLKV